MVCRRFSLKHLQHIRAVSVYLERVLEGAELSGGAGRAVVVFTLERWHIDARVSRQVVAFRVARCSGRLRSGVSAVRLLTWRHLMWILPPNAQAVLTGATRKLTGIRYNGARFVGLVRRLPFFTVSSPAVFTLLRFSYFGDALLEVAVAVCAGAGDVIV